MRWSLGWSVALVGCGLQSAGTAPSGALDGSLPVPDAASEAASSEDSGVDALPPLVDASPDVSIPPADSGTDAKPTDPGVLCGQTHCNAATQYCCITLGPTATCLAKNASCSGLTVRCDSKADCPGNEVCCGNTSPSAACKPTCNVNEAKLCDPSSGECTCTGTFLGYRYCQ